MLHSVAHARERAAASAGSQAVALARAAIAAAAGNATIDKLQASRHAMGSDGRGPCCWLCFHRPPPTALPCIPLPTAAASAAATELEAALQPDLGFDAEFERFKAAAESGANLVPLYERVMSDQLTPVLAYRCAAAAAAAALGGRWSAAWAAAAPDGP